MAASGPDFLTSKMLEASEPSLPEDSLMVLVGGGGLGGFGLGGLGLSSSPPGFHGRKYQNSILPTGFTKAMKTQNLTSVNGPRS
jgi:hypothetical protein